MAVGTPFCVFGEASGYQHEHTKLKEHTFEGQSGSAPAVEI
jgi:hypothetical protein